MLKGDFLVLEICEKYGWTWAEFMATPTNIIATAIEKMKIDAKKANTVPNQS